MARHLCTRRIELAANSVQKRPTTPLCGMAEDAQIAKTDAPVTHVSLFSLDTSARSLLGPHWAHESLRGNRHENRCQIARSLAGCEFLDLRIGVVQVFVRQKPDRSRVHGTLGSTAGLRAAQLHGQGTERHAGEPDSSGSECNQAMPRKPGVESADRQLHFQAGLQVSPRSVVARDSGLRVFSIR